MNGPEQRVAIITGGSQESARVLWRLAAYWPTAEAAAEKTGR